MQKTLKHDHQALKYDFCERQAFKTISSTWNIKIAF